MNDPVQTHVTTHQAPYDAPVANPAIHRMREGFRTLADECVPDMYRAGLDFDDTIVRRFAVCKTPDDREITIPIDNLADQDRLRRDLVSGAIAAGVRQNDAASLHIVGLRVDVIAETTD